MSAGNVLKEFYHQIDTNLPTSVEVGDEDYSISINLPNFDNDTPGKISVELNMELDQPEDSVLSGNRIEGEFIVGIFLPNNIGVLPGYELADIVNGILSKKTFRRTIGIITGNGVTTEVGQLDNEDLYAMVVTVPFKTSNI